MLFSRHIFFSYVHSREFIKMRKSLKEEVKFLQGKLEENEQSILFARLADAFLQMDRVDDAIECCEQGIKKHPYYVTGHYVLGKCYLKKKLLDQAEKELKRVLLFDQKYIAAHRDYGELMAQIGWHNTCEMSYEEIIRIDPFNEKAKQRLFELKEQSTLKEEQPEEKSESELQEVEESILTEAAPEFEKEPEEEPGEIEDEIAIETSEPEFVAPQQELEEPEVETIAPPVVKELFKESEDIFEEDKANLDLLEDIFRDDDLPDLSPGDEFENPIREDTNNYEKKDLKAGDQNYLIGEEFHDESVIKDIDGLNDEEVFALMSGDDEFDQPKMRSPLDIPEPPTRRERKKEYESPDSETPGEMPEESEQQSERPLKETLEYIQKETKPKFEPPIDKTPHEPQPVKKPIQVHEEPESFISEDAQRKKEKIVTSTLGEIYAAQHQYAKAIGVYEILRRKDPDNELYKQKIDYLQKKLEESQSE
jgi:tetratricopeptide (TPR) repeat protein